MTRHLILFIALLALQASTARNLLQDMMPSQSPLLQGYHDIDSVKNRISERPISPIEGLWQLAGNQAIVAIEPATSPQLAMPGSNMSIFQVVVVSSPRKSVRPGTVLGYFTLSGRESTYDAYLYTSRIRSALKSHRRYNLTLSPDQLFLTMTPVKSRWHMSLRHSFNFLMRAYVYNSEIDTPAPDGFVKIFPITGKPHKPVYL